MANHIVDIEDTVELTEYVEANYLLEVFDSAAVSDGATPTVDFLSSVNEVVTVTESLSAAKYGFTAKGIAPTRVLLVFGTLMPNTPTLTNTATYQVTRIDGTVVPIASVQAYASAIILTLSTPLTSSRFYIVTIAGALLIDGVSLATAQSMFQWIEGKKSIRLPLRNFSGEVSGGLLGEPLEAPAAASAIQVDEVSVCTKAYDSYVMPQPVDPPLLFTYSSIYPNTTLNSSALWAGFPTMVEARIEPTLHEADTKDPYDDGSFTAILEETWDPAYVSLLNSTGWKLFDNAGTPPSYFMTANNTAVIPAGVTTSQALCFENTPLSEGFIVSRATMVPVAEAVVVAEAVAAP
jgi:hypothetical protein